MSKKRKVLLIVEGERVEVQLFNQLFKVYNLSLNYDIFPYKTSIYELYERMFKGNEDCLDSLDLIQTLKSKDPDNKLLDEYFSDIVLIFDYEPQDNRFTPEKIELMLNYFNKSTDNGKLYINYPMVESFKHLKSIPDRDYIDRIVSLDTVKKGKYKELVGKEAALKDIRKYDQRICNQVIIHNIIKSYYILYKNYNMNEIREMYEENRF